MFCCSSRDEKAPKETGDNFSFFGLFHNIQSTKSFAIGKDEKSYTIEKKPFLGLPEENFVLVEVHFATLTIKDRETFANLIHPVHPTVQDGEKTPEQPQEFKTYFGHDFSGIVMKAGEKSGYFKGDQVYGWVEAGAFSDLILLNAAQLSKVPKNITLDVAANLPYAGWVAFKALTDLKKDEKVHINASGFLVDFLTVIASKTTSNITGNIIRK